MNCANLENLLADYLDGTLASASRSALETHAETCAGCREFVQDAAAGLRLAARVPEIEPPPELITRIAYQAPIGRTRRPFETQGWLSRLVSRFLQPILQPRFAMGMAMTILSFAMLERCTGVRVQHIQTADLNPVRIWDGVEDRAILFKDRAVKYYENIRFVYEVEARLRELEQQATADDEARRKRAARERRQSSPIVNGAANAPQTGAAKSPKKGENKK